MKNSQLFEVLQSLNLKERRLLLKFVQSPFHNSRADVIRLCTYLLKELENSTLGNLSKESIFPRIYKNEVYNEKKFRYTMSFLYKTIKAFLAYEEFSSNPVEEQLYLARVLKRKGLLKIAEQELEKCDKQLSKQLFRNIDFHFIDYQIGYEKFNVFSVYKREKLSSVPNGGDKLTIYFIANILRHSCSALSLKMVSTDEHQSDLLDEVLILIEKNNYLDIPAIAVYYHTYKTFTDSNAEFHFKMLRNIIQEHRPLFPKKELINIYLSATNFCIQQANIGKSSYIKELFSLYQEALIHGIFIENNILNRFTYKNIAMAGLMQKEFDWVENFIYQYEKYLEKKYRKQTVQFNLANLYFHKTDYHKAMDLLIGVTFNDLLNDLAARRMLLKIYFELKEIVALNSLLASFKNFIYRHKELGYHKTNYLNLIKFTKRLLNLAQYDAAAIKKLKKNIEETGALAEKNWLLEQIGKY